MSGTPYIVSHANPEVFYGDDHCGYLAPEEVLSRVAVGSLEEAHIEAMRAIQRSGVSRSVDRFRGGTLPASGGSVSLPDGTRVEVRATTWLRLHDESGTLAVWCHGVALDAWNAEHGR